MDTAKDGRRLKRGRSKTHARQLSAMRNLMATNSGLQHYVETSYEREKEMFIMAKWNHKEEKVLLELMVEEVKKGGRPTTTFTKMAWKEIIEEFYKRTGNRYTKPQFINKFNKLRLIYREFKKLRDIPTGFAWDPVSKNVIAPDDVWEEYLKINNNAKQFRYKGCPIFDELEVVYGENAGPLAQEAANNEKVLPLVRGLDNDAQDISVDLVENRADTNEDNVAPPVSSQGNHVHVPVDPAVELDEHVDFVEETNVHDHSITPSSRRRCSKSTSSFAEACTSVAEYYQSKLASLDKSVKNDNPFSIKNCIALLSSIPGVSKEIYLKTLKVIMTNQNWREAFMFVPEDIRPLMLTPSELEQY